ncbi:MAG TPA: hypothetical protein DCG37_08155 [Lachnospiraceae bacterium]|nr:hypothetical protein [Lachnospiraceae bacterium]
MAGMKERDGNSGGPHKLPLLLIIAAGAVLTALRIYIGCRIPMILKGDYAADDVLMMRYADSLLKGEWLGAFRGATLTKVAGYSVYAAILSKLNIPHTVGSTVLFCFCLFLFCTAFYKLYPNIRVIFAMYIFILFTPIMLNTDSIQKTYRVGFLVMMTFLLIASVTGLFGTILRKQHLLRTLFWSLMSAVSLVWFWFTKEDGIWLMPFVVCGLLISLLVLFFGDQEGGTESRVNSGGTDGSGSAELSGGTDGSGSADFSGGTGAAGTAGRARKAVCVAAIMFPLVCLGISSYAVRAVNRHYYGEFAVTDRNDTYYSKVISDLYHIDDGEQPLIIWLRRSGLEKAFEVSPTLAEAKFYIDYMYLGSWAVGEDGEMHGDNIYWALREAFEFNGLYKKGGAAVNEHYKKIHEELTAAFENGTLPKDTESIYISSGGRGMTRKEIAEYFPGGMRRILSRMLHYSNNVTEAAPSTGPEENIQMMADIVKSPYVFSDGSNAGEFALPIALAEKVTAVYAAVGVPLTGAAFAGFLLFGLGMLIGLFRKNFDRVPIMLVSVGAGSCALVYTFGILWFCAWNSLDLAYEYLGPVILIMNVLQILGISFLVCEIRNLMRFAVKKVKEGDVHDEKKSKLFNGGSDDPDTES